MKSSLNILPEFVEGSRYATHHEELEHCFKICTKADTNTFCFSSSIYKLLL